MYSMILNTEPMTVALSRVASGLSDMSPVMGMIAEYLLEATEERFQQGRAPDGSAWAPKSPVTVANYLRKGKKVDPRPLFGPSGDLKESISYSFGPDFAEIGANTVYAAVMQLGAGKGAFGTTSRGSPIPWGDIPARPYLGVSAEDETQISAILSDYLQTAANGGA